MMKFKTKDLKIAEVRYYDSVHNGIEYTLPLSYVVLINSGDSYDNVLCPGDVAPIYKRVPGTTNAYSTEDYYGTKIQHVCGNEDSGKVFLLTGSDLSREFGKSEASLKEVEDFVLTSDDFYYNRADIVDQRLKKARFFLNKERFRLAKIKARDAVAQEEMDSFFAERGVQKVYHK